MSEAELMEPRAGSGWPADDVATCACPYCGSVNTHQVSIAPELRMEVRDGQCNVCHAEYVVEPRAGKLAAVKLGADASTFLVEHQFDNGDRGVSIKAPLGFDARRAAVYIQLSAERWFGPEKQVSNLGIAAALVSFYGCRHAARNLRGEVIDMFTDRDTACRRSRELLAGASLARPGLRDFVASHLDG